MLLFSQGKSPLSGDRTFSPGLYLVILIAFLLAQLWIHQYIFLYADDLYYSRDAQYGLSYLPYFIVEQLNLNGRVWIATAMFFLLKPQIYFFRFLNPIILLLTVIILAKMSSFHEEPLGNMAYRENKEAQGSLGFLARLKKVLEKPNLGVSLLCGCLFFLYLPLPIAHTTIYYAACAFNYLYPMTLALLYGYWLYTAPLQRRVPLLFLSFFVASSTQQVGMIGFGYTVMIAFYLSLILKRVRLSTFIPYLLIQIIGYSILSYGSIQRLLSEKEAGKEALFGEVLNELIKTNIFSPPAAPFVALLCLSCVFWLWHKANSESFFNRYLGIILGIATLGYFYLLFNENILIQLPGGNSFTWSSIATLAFTLLFLFSVLYVPYLLLRQGQTPFLFFNSINAIGAQLMLLVVDARFAAAYKVMFPSLLLLSVFIFYSIVAFRHNLLYLALALGLITLIPRSSGLFSLVILAIILAITLSSHRKQKIPYVLGILFILSTLSVFSQTLTGYYLASIPQNYNLQAIAAYHERGREGELILRKVPVSYYGYNLGNWQTMPHFLRECYKIKEDTPIRYFE